MRRTFRAAVAAAATAALAAHTAAAGVVVSQIEAFEVDGGDNANAPTRYAAVEFGGAGTVTPTTGAYAGITFHGDAAVDLTTTYSVHAAIVANSVVGAGVSPAYGLVSDVYATEADAFLANVVNVQDAVGVAAAPTTLPGSPSVVNNSYVGDFGVASTNLDSQRRIDFMIARDGFTFVAAAATGITQTNGVTDVDPAVWSSYDALAVRGAQSFDPTNSPGKPHADLSLPNTEASFGTAAVSGYAAALVGRATAAGLGDATRDTVVRGLLMAGADKGFYNPTLANHLDPVNGAGQPDYDASVGILQGGEKVMAIVAGGAVTGPVATSQQGWAAGTVPAAGQSVVLFNASSAVTGLTASLNWDVTSNASGGQINTTSVIFPNLTLDVRRVTFSNGTYVLGAAATDAWLRSGATGDNIQYLYSASTLTAGTYAFVFTGDANRSAAVGFSYVLRGSFASQFATSTSGSWDTMANWTNGVPNAAGAVAVLPGTTASTVTLDGDRRVGKLTLGGGAYTISAGTGGTLTFDDSGDSTGTAAPTLTVTAGTHTITAPVALATGLTVNTAANSAVSLAAITGSGGLTKAGNGLLVLTAPTAYGTTTVNGGTLTLAPAATLGDALAVTGGAATFAAGTGGVTVRNVSSVSVATGGLVTLNASAGVASRTLLQTSALTLVGGRLDLGNGDLLVHNGSLAALSKAAAVGFGGGTWNGSSGLVSSTAAAAAARHLTGVGVVQNDAGGGAALFATFDGQPAVTTDVLARYTYDGDTNLDGVVNAADYTRIDAGFVQHLTGWANGDFNYDGTVDGSDYALMDNAFNQQPTALAATIAIASPSATAAVPEPALVLPGLGVALAVRRRRRTGASPTWARSTRRPNI